MRYSYNQVWQDTAAMLRADASLLAALAGAFMLLPSLLIGYALPQPTSPTPASLYAWYEAHIGWLTLSSLVTMAGTIAIYLLLLGAQRLTVGAAIVAALALLPFYFLATLLSSLMIGAGVVLLVVPGLYLYGRLAPIGPVVVAEGRRNPIDAIRRAFELTRGTGWRNLGIILLVFVAAGVVALAITAVVGTILMLAAGPRVGAMLVLILNGVATTAMTLLHIVLLAALYRALSAAPAPAATTGS